MRFLIDAQLPKQLSDFLNQSGYDSIHTLHLLNANRTSDKELNEISLKENRVLTLVYEAMIFDNSEGLPVIIAEKSLNENLNIINEPLFYQLKRQYESGKQN